MIGVSLASSSPADAHHQRKNLNTSGLSFPSLTHGQLRVMAVYRSDILDLAAKQVSPDLDTRTLRNFINLQFTYCLWGIFPGSLTDEDSPFNECSHAYLSASKALLDRLERVSDDPSAASELAARINREMQRDQSALRICRNSVNPFNTAEIILPEWSNVTFNPLILLMAMLAVMVLAGLAVAARNGRLFPRT